MATPSISGALISGKQETNVALATLNFDFSLWKVEPPQEFKELGACLSRKRREVAEDGLQHVTARKLGALFRGVLPNVPALVTAYGNRASEIAKTPDFNPKGTRADGAFADFVGADGTSIWAAATSGHEAILIHLLACMLARMWSSAEATAIWHEFVEERRKKIKATGSFDSATILASQASITRMQLADWDASARAWLKVADKAKFRQQKKLMLIIQDFGLVVNNKKDTYEGVLEAWTQALTAVDRLVQGIPQNVQNGAVLLGLAAWHLYPDMIALESSRQLVEQKDNLMQTGAVVTLGVKNTSPSLPEGTYWSLPLTYLRHYGDPITVGKSVGAHTGHTSILDLSLIALGCIFRDWGLEQDRFLDGAKLIWHVGVSWRKTGRKIPYWLPPLAQAAHAFCKNVFDDEKSLQAMMRTISYGRRRCSKFLSDKATTSVPFFGLCDRKTFSSLLSDADARIDYLRAIASKYAQTREGLRLVIAYKNSPAEARVSLATAVRAHRDKSGKLVTQNVGDSGLHHRWISHTALLHHNATELHSALDPDTVKLGGLAGRYLYWADTSDCVPTDHTVLSTTEHSDSTRMFEPEILNRLQEATDAETDSGFVIVSPPKAILSYVRLWGEPNTAALYGIHNHRFNFEDIPPTIDLKDLLKAFENGVISSTGLASYMISGTMLDASRIKSLQALAIATALYKGFPEATVYLGGLVDRPFHSRRWVPKTGTAEMDLLPALSKSQTFACIALLETGALDCNPDMLDQVMALSSDSSIYIAESLLRDPGDIVPSRAVKRVIGNIGKAGLALMVPPRDPRSRKPKEGEWAVVNHYPYDQNSKDCIQDRFEHTSLHLSLTDYTIPFTIEHEGARDIESYFQEAVISIFDRSEWVADLDILGSLQSRFFKRARPRRGNKPHNLHVEKTPINSRQPQSHLDARNNQEDIPVEDLSKDQKLTSVDSWYEFLDRPENTAVVRAHGNWIARLAAACLSVQTNNKTIVLPSASELCWPCVYEQFCDVIGSTSPGNGADVTLIQ